MTDAAEPFETRRGRTVVLPGMTPADRAREDAFVRGLSDRARQRRFLSGMAALTPALLDRFTTPDPERETVIVAVDPATDAIVAVARTVIDERRERAEFAIVVADAWQGDGLGRELMRRLVADTRARGIPRLEGIVLRENRDMRRLLRPLGFNFRVDADDPTVSLATLALDGAVG